MRKIRSTLIAANLIVWACSIALAESACAFDSADVASIGAAYATHIFLHEMGHHVVAQEVGAVSPQMNFFTQKGGKLYPGLSTCKSVPDKSRLPYAVGGERMAGYTFEYALQSYRSKPTTYNKALMFFSCADFLFYTLLANYVDPDNEMCDPNLIRAEIGCSKEVLLGLVVTKSLLNTYRVMNPNANFAPMIWVDRRSAALLFSFRF